jgi:hypothetical protein
VCSCDTEAAQEDDLGLAAIESDIDVIIASETFVCVVGKLSIGNSENGQRGYLATETEQAL